MSARCELKKKEKYKTNKQNYADALEPKVQRFGASEQLLRLCYSVGCIPEGLGEGCPAFLKNLTFPNLLREGPPGLFAHLPTPEGPSLNARFPLVHCANTVDVLLFSSSSMSRKTTVPGAVRATALVFTPLRWSGFVLGHAGT